MERQTKLATLAHPLLVVVGAQLARHSLAAVALLLFPAVQAGVDLTLLPSPRLVHLAVLAMSTAQFSRPAAAQSTRHLPATAAPATRPLLPSNPHTHPAAAVVAVQVRLRTAAQVARAVTMALVAGAVVLVTAAAVLSAAMVALAALAS